MHNIKLLFLTCLLVVSASPTAYAAPQIIKLATIAPEGSSWDLELRELKANWEERSSGAIEVRIFAGGVAGGDLDAVRKLRIGQIQAATLSNFALMQIASETFVLTLPMLFRSPEEYSYVRERIRPEIEAKVSSAGFTILAWSDIGWSYLFSRKPVITPEDLKPLKLGTLGNNPANTNVWTAAGYRPVPMSFPELLPALQSGLVEAMIAVPVATLTYQWYRQTPHMTNIAWTPLPGVLIISNKVWKSLPADLRPDLRSDARAIAARSEAGLAKMETEAIAVMKERGLTVHELTPEIARAWEERAHKAYPSIVGRTVPKELFDKVERLIAEYRNRSAAH